MYDICCIGHITLDHIITRQLTKHMAGGTSYYFSNAIGNMDVNYVLVTALAQTEMYFVNDLRKKGIEVSALQSEHTVCFENSYADDQNHRTQRVLQKANPFTIEQLAEIEASMYHLGPLLADDIPVEVISMLSKKGRVSLDVQGYMRKVLDKAVHAIDWHEKHDVLKYIHTLKANEDEAEVLTGQKDIRKSARILCDWGVKEVVITLGSRGSIIFADGIFYDIPAYTPTLVVDATGCGDTYMAGYLYQRFKGADITSAGKFAAAMSSLKIQASGPFTGSEKDVIKLLLPR
jgi:sugar/nucleoside kinase (ribokinase family)